MTGTVTHFDRARFMALVADPYNTVAARFIGSAWIANKTWIDGHQDIARYECMRYRTLTGHGLFFFPPRSWAPKAERPLSLSHKRQRQDQYC